MSTSLMYHVFGLSDYDYVHQKFTNCIIIFRIRPNGVLFGVRYAIKGRYSGETYVRRLRPVPIGFKSVWPEVELPRVYCPKCWCFRQINSVIAQRRKSYTRVFERYVIALSKVMTLTDIARLLYIGWDCVKDIIKSWLLGRFSRVSFKSVRYLGIDEISIRKGHKDITLVMDLERGNVYVSAMAREPGR